MSSVVEVGDPLPYNREALEPALLLSAAAPLHTRLSLDLLGCFCWVGFKVFLAFLFNFVASKMSGANASNFWRAAGLSYLQYLNIASRVTRISLKVALLSVFYFVL